MKSVPLTQGQIALVDSEDFPWLIRHRWCAVRFRTGPFYAYTNILIDGEKRSVSMHRMILGFPEGRVDHKNRDGLDNRRDNLRRATVSQNGANSEKRKNCSSVFKGVYWHRKAKKWAACCCRHNKTIHLGLFEVEEVAASAYDEKALEVFGPFAKINFK